MALEPEVVETLSPVVRRITANNPSVFTGPGTNTYLIGSGDVTVIDCTGYPCPSHCRRARKHHPDHCYSYPPRPLTRHPIVAGETGRTRIWVHRNEPPVSGFDLHPYCVSRRSTSDRRRKLSFEGYSYPRSCIKSSVLSLRTPGHAVLRRSHHEWVYRSHPPP